MPRQLKLQDHQGEAVDAAILTSGAAHKSRTQGPDGQPVTSQRVIKSSPDHGLRALLKRYGSMDAVGQALIDGDPEIDAAHIGRKLGPARRVWLRQDGEALYTARRLEVIEGPDGAELERKEALNVEATVLKERALPWTGQLLDPEDVVRAFALVKKLQLRHKNPHSRRTLYELASHLHGAGKLLLVGAGESGRDPLIFQRNSQPYRGFLEGRVRGEAYLLVLHLSNLDLRVPSP